MATIAEVLGVGDKAQAMSFDDLIKALDNADQSALDQISEVVPGLAETIQAVSVARKTLADAQTAYDTAVPIYEAAYLAGVTASLPGGPAIAAAKIPFDAAKGSLNSAQSQVVSLQTNVTSMILQTEIPV